MNENQLRRIRRLWEHARWADVRLLGALGPDISSEALREQAHIVGALEVWLSRLEGRTARCAVWPEVDLPELERLMHETYEAYGRYLSGLGPSDLRREVTYVNSAGDRFTNAVEDILIHAFMHAHYHRGKVNLLLRQAGSEPAAADYIAFVRGAPAATVGDPRRAAEGQSRNDSRQ